MTSGAGQPAHFIVFEGGEEAASPPRPVSSPPSQEPSPVSRAAPKSAGGVAAHPARRSRRCRGGRSGRPDRGPAHGGRHAQHVAELIRPTLAWAPRRVRPLRRLLGRLPGPRPGPRPKRIREISEWAVDGLWPDLVVLLQVDAAAAAAGARGATRPHRGRRCRLPCPGGRRVRRAAAAETRPMGRRRRVGYGRRGAAAGGVGGAGAARARSGRS